jgi:predicted N-acetyltransferase YhbS
MSNESAVAIRKFEPTDIDGVHELILRVIDACYPADYSPAAIEYFKAHHCVENILADAARGFTVVAAQGSKFIATGTLLGTNIRRMFVDPACQGQGVGRRIMAVLVQKARELHLPGLDLCSTLGAKGFYEGLGFRVTQNSTISLPRGQRLDYYDMARSLSQ